jgi:hypothetical protein
MLARHHPCTGGTMNRLTSLGLALAATLLAAPAFAADAATAQDPQSDATNTAPDPAHPRELDVLVVTGATQSGDRWARDDAKVPEIADGDWVDAPAPAAPAN